MATTMFFEEKLKDLQKPGSIELEFGRSSYYGGISRIYVNVDGKSVILDEAQGRRLCEAMDGLRAYLQYDKP